MLAMAVATPTLTAQEEVEATTADEVVAEEVEVDKETAIIDKCWKVTCAGHANHHTMDNCMNVTAMEVRFIGAHA